jgi:hypothetical protein
MEKFGQNGIVLGRQIVDAADMALGDDEQMHRRVGVDVPKDDQVIVLVQKGGLGFS